MTDTTAAIATWAERGRSTFGVVLGTYSRLSRLSTEELTATFHEHAAAHDAGRFIMNPTAPQREAQHMHFGTAAIAAMLLKNRLEN